MRGPTQVQLDFFDGINDEQLRRFSVRFLDWTFITGVVNMVLFYAGVVSFEQMVGITAFLSYLAIWMTCGQTVVVTDVKKTVDT